MLSALTCFNANLILHNINSIKHLTLFNLRRFLQYLQGRQGLTQTLSQRGRRPRPLGCRLWRPRRDRRSLCRL